MFLEDYQDHYRSGVQGIEQCVCRTGIYANRIFTVRGDCCKTRNDALCDAFNMYEYHQSVLLLWRWVRNCGFGVGWAEPWREEAGSVHAVWKGWSKNCVSGIDGVVRYLYIWKNLPDNFVQQGAGDYCAGCADYDYRGIFHARAELAGRTVGLLKRCRRYPLRRARIDPQYRADSSESYLAAMLPAWHGIDWSLGNADH